MTEAHKKALNDLLLKGIEGATIHVASLVLTPDNEDEDDSGYVILFENEDAPAPDRVVADFREITDAVAPRVQDYVDEQRIFSKVTHQMQFGNTPPPPGYRSPAEIARMLGKPPLKLGGEDA